MSHPTGNKGAMDGAVSDEYELISLLALALRDAQHAGEKQRARDLAATLAQEVHTAVVLRYRVAHDDAPAARILRNNGALDADWIARLLTPPRPE